MRRACRCLPVSMLWEYIQWVWWADSIVRILTWALRRIWTPMTVLDYYGPHLTGLNAFVPGVLCDFDYSTRPLYHSIGKSQTRTEYSTIPFKPFRVGSTWRGWLSHPGADIQYSRSHRMDVCLVANHPMAL